jgi:terminase large subunit-like protein
MGHNLGQGRSIAGDLALACDPVALARSVGFEPDEWQVALLRSTARRILMNCSRQSGKSSTAALVALHTALYQPNSLTLMVSPTERQSGELFKKMTAFYRTLGRPVHAESESALQLMLANGSRVVALPGREGTIRSYSGVALLVIDEASRVEDATFMSVRPMLSVSQGRLIALSTPFGSWGWWYDAWISDAAWERYEVPADSCPRITPETLEQERREMGHWWFEQEYLCRFLDSQTAAFRTVDIERAFSEDYETWDLGLDAPAPTPQQETPATEERTLDYYEMCTVRAREEAGRRRAAEDEWQWDLRIGR